MAKKLRFIFIRLKHSSIRELIYRANNLLFGFVLSNFPIFLRCAGPGQYPNFEQIQSIQYPNIGGHPDKEIQLAVLDGYCFCLHESVERVTAFEKSRCQYFYSRIRVKPNEPDIRAVWESGRLQNLSLLLQTINKGRSVSLANNKLFIRTSLLTWLSENPLGYGPHYMSAMECGLRVPLFLGALQLIDSWSSEEAQRIIQAIYQHGWFIRNRLSLFSSLGNHTIAECVGLVFAGGLFLKMKEGSEWLEKGIELLEQECRHQILPDGGPGEQSSSYLRFILDLYWFAIEFLEANNLYNCTLMTKRVATGEKFLTLMQQNQEPELKIGDSDDGHVICQGFFPEIRTKFSADTETVNNITFSDSGYTILRTKKGGRLLMDHGPLGLKPLYNHGHADALSVVLSVGLVEFLVDPGTYQYNGDQKFRRYFKGTRAHNTVIIDGVDQAEQLTGFIWGEPYTVKWSKEKNSLGQEYLIASHNGYHRLSDPVTHKRKLFWVDEETFVLEDSFTGEGKHAYEINFHLHPDVQIERTQRGVLLRNCGVEVNLHCVSEQTSVYRGAKDPFNGWFSPSYGVLEETNTLQVRKQGLPSDIRFCTLLHIGKTIDENKYKQILNRCDIQY